MHAYSYPGTGYIITGDSLFVGCESKRELAHIQGLSL